MKKIFLLATFLCIVSCKEATKESTNADTTLKQPEINKVATPVHIKEEKPVEVISKEEVIENPPIIEKQVEAPMVKETPKAVIHKETIKKQEKAIVAQPEVVEKAPVEKAVSEVVKAPVIAKANHEAWDKLSKTYVTASGKVNYKGFKTKVATIDSYLLHLQNTPPAKGWSKNEKLAYWFNLYNASTVRLIVSNYPVKSIKDINGGKPWDKKFIKSGANVYSLNDIENTIVRPNYNEPRLHVAFNCAAVSCPDLLNGAFVPTKLNSQLSSLSKKWLSNASKNKISADNIEISQIFNWYKGDFREGVVNFINKYNSIKVNEDATVSHMKYDWALNE